MWKEAEASGDSNNGAIFFASKNCELVPRQTFATAKV